MSEASESEMDPEASFMQKASFKDGVVEQLQ